MARSGKVLTIKAEELEVGDILVIDERRETVTKIRGRADLKIYTAEGGQYVCISTQYVRIVNV